MTQPSKDFNLDEMLKYQERGYIVWALKHEDWCETDAAKLLGISFRSMRYRVKKFGIELPK